MSGGYTVHGFVFDPPKEADMDKAIRKSYFAAKQQIFTDCQKYVKRDQGTLEDTAEVHQIAQSIEITWHQPYALYAYQKGTPSVPGRQLRLAEYAQGIHGEEWCAILTKGMNDALSKI